MKAIVKILLEGYTTADVKSDIGDEKTRPTITLVKDRDIVMVVDPGTLSDQQILIDKLKEEGLTVNDVNIVCITHSHIDHYRNIGMFPKAKTLEYFGLWDGEKVDDWQEHFTENIQILKTPGHDYTGITLLVSTEIGKVAICGDIFWKENSPENDIYASDLEKLEKSRALVLKMADWVIPGHGEMYKSGHTLISKPKQEAEEKILGTCKRCHRKLFIKKDRCECQPWFCYHCCQCEEDCELCNCKRRR
ncbi:MAG: MBL fold metallo-hydrolase [Candidatus Staskawiczbacteria bacterium]|nr:MBL fold metallo-hydrolase [Candidatus Staskawiczbacteria bacterium]